MRPDSPAIPSMINFDGEYHKRRRNLVNRGFTPRRVADHEPKIREICVGVPNEAESTLVKAWPFTGIVPSRPM